MSELRENELYIINQLLEKRQIFALYKQPQDRHLHFAMQKQGSPKLFTDLSQLNGEEGFVIAPFKAAENLPIVLFHPDIQKLPTIEEVNKMETLTDKEEPCFEKIKEVSTFERYSACFKTFKQSLLSGAMTKIVLSRPHIQQREEPAPLAETFKKACLKYPNNYTYLIHTPQTGIWMGSTPEVLLDGSQNRWHTVALAGTQSYQKAFNPQWDSKNIVEQEVVVDYIKMQLNKLEIVPRISAPQNINAGQVVHRVSHFNFEFYAQSKLGDLLKLLHPTPAICGLPKEEAYQFILENENYNRKYYSGFIGALNPQGKTALYVNLRCMQIHSKNYVLYAGGGLLPSSSLEEEWQEIKNKMQTMQTILE